jgi:hypothetical protein
VMVVTGTSGVLPEEDHFCKGLYLWNRKLCVVVPAEDLPLEQEALCCGA